MYTVQNKVGKEKFLKLLWEEVAQSLGDRIPAGPEGETVHLNREDKRS